MFRRSVAGPVPRVRSRHSTGLAYGMVMVMGVTLLAGTPAPAVAAEPERLSVTQPPSGGTEPAKAKPRPADLSQGARNRRDAPVVWPAAGAAEVSLVPSGSRTAARGDGSAGVPAQVGTLPVWVAPSGAGPDGDGDPDRSGADAAAGAGRAGVDRARVEVLDRSAVPAAWRDGVVLRVGRADAVRAPGRLNVTVDYSGFAGAFGADWATRLRLVALPECALTSSGGAGCRPVMLRSRNDAGAGTVSADVDLSVRATGARADGGAGAEVGVLLAVQAAPAGETGDYGATPLQSSSSWVAGGSNGDFSWTYPIKAPSALGGPAPAISFDYSSSAVDGRSDASNNQPSWLGDGFDYAPGFIERRYVPCAEDKDSSSTNKTETGDLCWGIDNARLALSGRSGELIRDDSSKAWRLKNDDATKVERLTGATNGDKDGEYWKVTTADGVQYFFGRHSLPGQSAVTNSTNYVRVYGNHVDEPCYNSSFAAGHCDQAWRWNLDYVIDPRGNTMSLWYNRETNKYAANYTDSAAVTYVRASTLSRIDYGTWDRGTTDRSTTPVAQVIFTPGDRCLANCSERKEATWPDVPWDQECTGSSCAGNYAPTFWSTKRLAKVATRAAGFSGDVQSWTLTHNFPPNGDSSRDGMWLESIVHAGHVGGTVTLPEVNFDWVQRPNRVDARGDDKPAMHWMRLGTIWTESGGKISVTYSGPECVVGTRMPASPETNTLRCHPVLSRDPFTKKIETEYFHKYVVAEVSEENRTDDGTAAITTYEYLDGAAWRYTPDDGITLDKFRTWSDYRGYGRVRVREGAHGQETLTESRYYRGMHGSRDTATGGTRTVHMPAVDLTGDGDTVDPGDAPRATDENAFAGQIRQQTVYNGVDSDIVSVSVNQAWQSAPTATRDMGDDNAYARFTGIDTAWEATRLDAGRGWRVTKQSSTFDSYGMVSARTDHGDVAVADDQQCQTTSYARNTDTNLLALPSRVQTHALPCGQAPTSPDDVINDVRTFYDGRDHGAAPTLGNANRVDVLKGWTASGGTSWLTVSTSKHDAFGRTVEETDVRGNLTRTDYTPASGGPVTKVTVTNHREWESSEEYAPGLGLAVRSTDVNGKVTERKYDALGRLTGVWLPNRSRSQHPDAPSERYAYLIRNNGQANAVTEERLNAAGTYTTTHHLYDGLLRSRQTQKAAASGGGTILTETSYDAAGRVAYTVSNHHDPDLTPGTTLRSLASWQGKAQTVNRYDRAGRLVESSLHSGGDKLWGTVTGYGGDRTYLTPPPGGTPTTTITDGRGNTVELREHSGGSVNGGYDATRYVYNRKNQLVAVVDPAGNEWSYGYDPRGRQVSVDDPDKGHTTFTVEDNGDTSSMTDAKGGKLVYTYDDLGRRTNLYASSIAPANRLASWSYDPTGARNQLASASRWTSGGSTEYRIRIRGYSPLYQSTGEDYVIPAAETGLGGTYTFTRGFAADGVSLATATYPRAGGLGAEQLSYTYDQVTGLPEQLRTNWPGAGQYVTDTGWTAFGELGLVEYQQTGQNWVQRAFVYEDATRRLVRDSTIRQLAPQPVSDVSYEHDPAGNIVKIADTPAGTPADTQCFRYDYQRRLTAAWTPGSGDCRADPSVAGLGGPAAYWHSWTFDPLGRSVGNRDTETRHGATNTVAKFNYPAPKADRPHATTSVVTTGTGAGTTNYSYDAIGNTTCRPVPGASTNSCSSGANSQILNWDVEGKLAAVTVGAAQHSYLYDADGNRLIARDPGGRTLYLPDTEIRVGTDGLATATRYYTHQGRACATRTTGGLSWLIGDHQGTGTVAIAAGSQAVTKRRQTPYGEARGADPAWPNQKGFVGGDRDATGLVQLGARQYDSRIGRFVSVDPLQDLGDPEQWNAYAYGNNSPVTFSDPDGRKPLITDSVTGDEAHERRTGEKVVMRNGKWTVGKSNRRPPRPPVQQNCNRVPCPKPGPSPKAPQPPRPHCPTVWLNGSCMDANSPQLRPGNLLNGATQHGIDRAVEQGGTCELIAVQIICYNSRGYLVDGHAQAIGDVLLYPGTKDDWQRKLEREATRRANVARICDKVRCLDPSFYGPDIEKHEAAHSDQWATAKSVLHYGAAYGAEQLMSVRRCGVVGKCNNYEIGANPYHGGYWEPPKPEADGYFPAGSDQLHSPYGWNYAKNYRPWTEKD